MRENAPTACVEFEGTIDDLDTLSVVISLGIEKWNEEGRYAELGTDRFGDFCGELIDALHELDNNPIEGDQ
ncbi:hypothetical protein [Halocatena halophila]|uniref:hypothetical protein n=1 Tax=Halocatena halophila TaxID=2814576 RepID=UPI002ED2F302